jgi:hypothetical protein
LAATRIPEPTAIRCEDKKTLTIAKEALIGGQTLSMNQVFGKQ